MFTIDVISYRAKKNTSLPNLERPIATFADDPPQNNCGSASLLGFATFKSKSTFESPSTLIFVILSKAICNKLINFTQIFNKTTVSVVFVCMS